MDDETNTYLVLNASGEPVWVEDGPPETDRRGKLARRLSDRNAHTRPLQVYVRDGNTWEPAFEVNYWA